MSIVTLIIFLIFCVVVIIGIIEVQQGQRRIPVQYAKRVVGRKMYGGQATHIPLKVNQAGVIPVIFAMAFLQFPLTITYFMDSQSGAAAWITKWLSPCGTPGVWVYAAFNVVLIIFFTYFYTSVTFNPDGSSTEHESQRRIHTGNKTGQSNCRISEQSDDKNHFRRCGLPGSSCDTAYYRESAWRTELPLRRYIAADRCRCRAGYDETA